MGNSDNVIRPRFGTRPRMPPQNDNEAAAFPLKRLADMMAANGIESLLAEVILPMRNHFAGLQGPVSETSIILRKEELAKLSDDEIRTIARAGNPLKWSAKPAYYLALLDVIVDRKMLI